MNVSQSHSSSSINVVPVASKDKVATIETDCMFFVG